MTNQLYDKARQRFLTAQINWTTATIKAVLVSTSTYTVNASSHEYLSDIGTTSRIATSSAFTTPTATSGAADADDVTFSSVTGSAIGAIVIYSEGSGDSTSPLIAYIDSASGLPITPNGGDIIITWDSGTNKIFKL